MPDRSVKVKFEAVVGGFVAGVTQAKAATADLGKTLEKSTKSRQAFTTIGTAALGAGLAIGALVGTAVKKFADFDAAMSAAASVTGATGAELDGLRQLALKMGADTMYSATEAAQAITEMGKAGVSTADIMGGGLQGALALAAAGQIDVGRAGEIAATALNQFGLAGKDLPHVADLIAAAAGKAQGGVEDVANAMKFVGPVAKNLGISIEETAGAIAELAAQGIIGEQAGTSLRGVLLSLTAPSKIAQGVMEKYGISVYDTGGHVKSLAGLSQSLQDRLAPLDEATRNAALGQIFGNAQITAATILYKGGAKSVDDWTAKVNDAGYAQKQAAALTNNLAGDVERLGGSLDTVFIQTGSGLNDGLRGLTQGLEGLVNTFGSLSAPVQQGVLKLAAVTAGALLVGGAVLVAVPKVVAFRSALETLTVSSGRASTSLSTLGKAAGVIGVAAASVELTKFAAAVSVADPPTKQLAAGLLDVANNAKESKDFGTIFASGAGIFSASINSTSDAVKDFGANAKAALDPTSYETFFGTAGTASGVFQERVSQIDKALVALVQGGHAQQAAAVVDKLSQSTVEFGGNADKVRASFTGYQASLDAVAPAADGASTAAAGASLATGDLADAQVAATAAANAQAEALDAAKKAVSDYGSATADAISGTINLNQAISDANTGLLNQKGNLDSTKLGLDLNTQAGRDNTDALLKIAQAAKDGAVANFSNNQSVAAVTAAMVGPGGSRDAFVATAIKMGATKAEANKLATQLGLTAGNVGQLTAAINGVPTSKSVTIQVMTGLSYQRIQAVKDAIDALHDKTLNVTTITQQKNIAAHGGVTGQAAGGPVYGPGTGTSDSVPRMLSTGEHVWTAAEVGAAGGQGAVTAMRKWVLTRPPGMAGGGPVTSVNVRALVPVASFPRTTGAPQGPLFTVGQINTVDAAAAARALERRFSDSLAAGGFTRMAS